jgi:SAM-dependent methyltransferase
VIDHESMATLYRASTLEYQDELDGLRRTYGKALDRLATLCPGRDGLLDIGTGSGFVLELALDRGWRGVRGIEPSENAVAKAGHDVEPLIVRDVMRAEAFGGESFDAVTMFQVLDHMPDPVGLLRECSEILRPHGVILALNHNVAAWSAKLLGERSPIVDVEHTYLYSPQTAAALFRQAGFEVLASRSVMNTYSLAYVTQLVPLPRSWKGRLLPALRSGRVGRVRVTVPLGNMCVIARRAG